MTDQATSHPNSRVVEPPSSRPPTQVSPNRPTRFRRTLGALGLVAILGASLWYARAPLLTAAAQALVVDDPLPAQADAIIVLGGGMNFRPTEAARLYHSGIAPKILVAYPVVTSEVALGVVAPEGQLATALLERLGVPRSAIEPLEPEVASTHDEALATRAWLNGRSCRTLLIPTDAFRARRAKWVFEKVLRGTGVEVRVTSIDPRRYGVANWWQREEGRNTFGSEAGKLLYYWARY